ncbi:MAG: efflux RND transporter periplasmic adaptor subunit [Alphaproteobacteria bacterium]|nr:MAG: efflux RND transporter periplasmic adaptor subunit [Alphaproteobacteria bacterium]
MGMMGGPPPPVSVAKPVVKPITEQDEFVGRFEATAVVEVRARVSGFLETVGFQDGAIVNQGDVLFQIDRRPYVNAVNQAQAQVTATQTRIEFLRTDLQRADRLANQGVAAERTRDERRQSFQVAQSEINGARAALDQARLDLAFTEIRAPIGGRISRKLVSEGNLVSANQTLLTTIVSIDPIHFYFDIDERSFLAYSRMANQMRPNGGNAGLPVLVGLATDREPTRPGHLDFLDNRLDPASGTMRVRAVFPNPDGLLTPGLFGRVRVPGSDPYNGVLIPDEAIGTDQDRRFVWVVAADGAVRPQVIRPGPRIDGYRVVRSGLTGEETIVISGLQRVRPGGRVTPQPTELPPVRTPPRS